MARMKNNALRKSRKQRPARQREEPRSGAIHLPFWKKILFGATVTVMALLAMEACLWILGVKPASLGRDPYAGFTPSIPHFLDEKGPDGTERLSVAPSKLEYLNAQSFARKKPPGTYRIVCLGGSTTDGRPFFDLTSYPGWLRAFLPVADPSRRWEVINAGAISYASYRVKGLMAELAHYEPDLFIIDVGHNEFLERRTYAGVFKTPSLIRSTAGLLSQTRTATLIQEALELGGLIRTPAIGGKAAGIGEDVKRIPLDTVGPEAYRRDEAFQHEVLAHFRSCLGAMVNMARSAGARIVFITPASNLKDFSPFKSEHGPALTTEQLRAWTGVFERGRALARGGKPAQALGAFRVAEALDDRHAELLYQIGVALLRIGQDDEARAYLIKARDEDICSLRASSATLHIIRDLARESGVPLIDFEVSLTRRAERGVAGSAQFADHVHHQLPTNRRLALDLIDELATEKIVTMSPDWNEAAIARITTEVEARIDRPRYAAELRTLSSMLMRLGQPEQAILRAREALALTGDEPIGLSFLGQQYDRAGDPAAAVNCCRRALALEPDSIPAHDALGIVLLSQRKPAEALDHLKAVVYARPGAFESLTNLGSGLC